MLLKYLIILYNLFWNAFCAPLSGQYRRFDVDQGRIRSSNCGSLHRQASELDEWKGDNA